MLSRPTIRCLLGRARPFSSASEVVVVSVKEAEAKTAAALRMVGWDEEDAALQVWCPVFQHTRPRSCN